MKILHVFSMAGVAEQLCHYGAGDKVLQLKQLDEFGFGEFYGKTEYFDNTSDLINRGMELEPDYDKVVIHFFPEFAFHFTPSKVVYMFHGSDIREKPKEYLEQFKDKNCFVTTVDLLEILPNAKLCPNPVDLAHFVNDDGTEFEIERNGDWFCINRGYQREYIEKDIKSLYPETEYYERNKNTFIDYTDMPAFLEQHTNYIDMKYSYDKPEPKRLYFLSCTALQALAVGCTVYNGNGKVTDGMLQLGLHDAERVAEIFVREIDN